MKIFLALFALAVSSQAKIYFEDGFTDGDEWEKRWVQSGHKSDLGRFKLSAGKFFGDPEVNKGLQTSEDARFYALSAKFDKFSAIGKKLVVQFTVKHEQSIDCGGGYVKIFPSGLDQTKMHGESPYNIMFGPDICGPGTKKVHVIFNHNKDNHLIKKDIRCKDDEFTHLYTLILDSEDRSYEVLIDNESKEKGKLADDWDFLPPKKIKDPEAKKPSQEEWDEREKIDDPNDTKPEDWDKPEHIPDPDAVKPEDWDEETDGEWEPANIDNPEYKGEWKPKQIDNPDYKGKWVHPEIDNPEYKPEEEKKLGQYDDNGVIGIDIWQVKSGTIFDDILITDDVDLAKSKGEKIIETTREKEKAAKEALDKVEEEKAKEATDSTPEDDDDEDEDEEEDVDEAAEKDTEEGHDEL